MTLTAPVTVAAKVSALASCLCAQIAADGLPKTCFCGLLPGETVVQDYMHQCDDDGCGMAWVRVAVGAPITGIGIQDQSLNNCAADLGFDVEVGIIRCMSIGEDGNPPTDVEQLEAAQLQLTEMETMRRAIMCCTELGDFVLDQYVPVGPTGGVVGGFWTLSAGLA